MCILCSMAEVFLIYFMKDYKVFAYSKFYSKLPNWKHKMSEPIMSLVDAIFELV